MTAKNSKVTLKTLQAEVNLLREELRDTKKELIEVKEELDSAKTEIKYLKAHGFAENGEKSGKSVDLINCKACENSFSSKKNLKIHSLETHKQPIKCKSCEETFDKNCDFEVHIQINHRSQETFKCEECGKNFVLKWRMLKHQDIHNNQPLKKCHFFNNQKSCPYEDIGCKFEHSVSEICSFGNKCTNNLCSFQHDKNDVKDTRENESNEHLEKLKEAFEMLSDDEQYESERVLCDFLCAAHCGYHKCSDADLERFASCDLSKFEDIYDPAKSKSVEYFPCQNCGEKFLDYEELNNHFGKNHEKNYLIKCPINCDYEFKSLDYLVKHIGVKHQDEVKRKLE